jgi:mono/diheme cytochrome c family protein
MYMTKRKLSLAIGTAALLLGGSVSAQPDYATALDDMKQHWGTIETYCTECHNADDYSGGVDFTQMSADSVAQDAELFEMALRKLRGNVMPPPSQEQPSEDERWQLVASLENTLDAHAAEHGDPGRVGLHRLNRTEYVNAIFEMTGVKLNPELVLPKDDNSDGFDNIAGVLKISPSFLDQYIAAARLVSDQAVGSPNPRNETVTYPVDSSHQGSHIHGLPLGTRGGVLVEHIFPVDGDYTLTIPRMASAGYTGGMEYEHTVVVTLDGEKIFERAIGGGEDLKALDQIQAPAVAEINGRFKDIPITVTSGPHKIGVAFIARSFAESDEFLHDLGVNRGMDRIARMGGVQITGPLKTNGINHTPMREKVMICEPASPAQEVDCARQILSNLAKQAYRRPLVDEDLEAPMAFYAEGREQGSFDAGIKNGMMAVLGSPKFLFRAEFAPENAVAGEVVAIGDIELASRLSFFLWSTLPDAELVDLASRGELRNGDNLQKQVERMLADPRAAALVDNFIFQWLRLRDLSNIDPDPEIFANYRPGLLAAFQDEIALFVGDLIRANRSVLELMTSEYTYLNEDLALHYGMTDIKGDQFRKVQLKQPERFGLLGKGGVQMVTSYANRTTPVIRGAYIMENFMGVPPANPPPNVEAFPETPEGVMVAETVRDRLERHRDNPACAGCHDVMDPIGLSLENFNAIGEFRLRDSDAGNIPIDATGKLADGTPINGVNDLRAALVKRPEQFVQVLTEKMMTYALGRSVEAHDMPAVRKIVREAADDNYSFAAIVKGVIDSEQFQKMTIPADGAQIGSR